MAIMYSGWPLLLKRMNTAFCFSIPHQSGVKGGTAFPRSLPLIIAFFKQVRINFCHPKHHWVLLQCRSLLIHHQLLPVSVHWAETGWFVWISVLEAFIPRVLTPIKPFQEEMGAGAQTLPCNKSSHLPLAGCHFLEPSTCRCTLPQPCGITEHVYTFNLSNILANFWRSKAGIWQVGKKKGEILQPDFKHTMDRTQAR